MVRTLRWAILLALASGDRRPPPAEWLVRFPDAGIDAVHLEAVAYAAEEWSQATGLRFRIRVEPGDCSAYGTICVRDVDMAKHVGWTESYAQWHADVEIKRGYRSGVMLDELCAHELGHALHLAHSRDPRDVMYPIVHAGQLTQGDLTQFRSVYK